MKLLWHIIKKDIVRDGWALALWALLFVAQIGVGATVLWGDGVDLNWVVKAQFGSSTLIWLQMGMGFVLIARWVHADALLGTKEFWMTRPVSGARLLGAKVAGVVLVFGFGPVLILLPWWLMCGFEAQDLVWTAGQTFGWQLVIILPALLIAAVTDELGRVLMGTLVLVLAVAVWASLWQTLPAAKIKVVGGVLETRLWLAAIIAVAGIAGIVVQQFLTRRWVRSLVMSVACVGVVSAVAQLWPWDWTTWPAVEQRVAAADKVDKVELKFLRATTSRLERGNDPALVDVSWKATGLPDGFGVRAEEAAHIWRWTDSLTFSRDSKLYGQSGGVPEPFGSELVPFDYRADPETLQIEIKALKDRRARSIERRGSGATFHNGQLAYLEAFSRTGRDKLGMEMGMWARMEVSPSLAAKMRATPSEMTVKMDLRLVRPELLKEMPWREGQRMAVKGVSLRLTSKEPNRDFTVARLVVSQASRLPWVGVFNMRSRDLAIMGGEYRNGHVVALNRTHGDRVNVRMETWSPAVIGGVVLSWRKLSLTEPWVMRDGKRVLRNADWWAGATLAFVAEKELGRFTKEARVEGFLLEK